VIARLQAAIVAGLVASMAASAWVWSQGWGGSWPGVVIALAVGGHALALAGEAVLMRGVNRRAGIVNDTPAQGLRAWWGEVLSAPRVFYWRQPFFSGRWPDRLAGRGRGVLLIHGYVCNRGVWNRWLRGLQQRSVPVVALTLEPCRGDIGGHVDAVERAVAALHAATGQAPVLVAHSMGGLVARCWRAAQPGNAARVHHLLTLGTPHHGTFLARWGLDAATRQMRPDSAWLRQLATREAALPATPTTCFYSHSDHIVYPPPRAVLAGAAQRRLVGVAHVHLVECGEPWRCLLSLLDLRG
jgi:predicted alpha/beta hydrolase family esterase